MPKICKVCGLPEDVCACPKLTQRKIAISLEYRKFGKKVTVISGDIKPDFLKDLKQKCACGGTLKRGKIYLQGDQREKVFAYLLEQGFSEKQIIIL